jgi:hypothetical protein
MLAMNQKWTNTKSNFMNSVKGTLKGVPSQIRSKEGKDKN